MPGDGLTHGPPAAKKQAAVTTGSARSTGIPCAVVLRLIRGLPGEPGFLATVTARIAPRDLAPASGRQDHTISPSAERCSSMQRIRVHRSPASRVVTIARTPLFLRRGGEMKPSIAVE